MTGAGRGTSVPSRDERRGFSHPTDDDQKRDDECANLLQATSQQPVQNPAEYSYDRAADADPNGEFHLALG
jgi:hypothetical protein